ncbi:MAG TPA: phospholipid carrier-dependent glycosyltransferase [Geobacteraceae bacterium]
MRRLVSNHHLWLWSLFALAFLLRGWALSGQPPLGDEVLAAFGADNYVHHGILGQIMLDHPPLRNWVIFLTGWTFGEYSAWGLRFGSVFLASLTVPLLGYFAHALFGRFTVTVLAALFLAVDPLHIGLCREAFQEGVTPFFIMAGLLSAISGLKGRGWGWHYAAGLFFGLASASKWHGLFPWALAAAIYLFSPRWAVAAERQEPWGARLLTTIAAYGALPVTVYVAAWLPWLLRGHSLWEFIDFQRSLVIAQYHHKASEDAMKYLPKRAYQWFLWPVPWNDFVFYQGKAYLNVAMGNFLSWEPTLPALYVTCREWLRKKELGTGLAAAVFLVSYLPLVFAKRGIWVFSAPAVIPFAFMLTAFAIHLLLERGVLSKRILCSYLAGVVLVSSLMYPMSTFHALDFGYTRWIAELYSPHPGEGR